VTNQGSYYTAAVQLTGGSPAQTAYEAKVTLIDMAGNVNPDVKLQFDAASNITVDTVPPAPIAAAQNNLIRYRRIPWGSNETAGVKKFSVRTEAACGPGNGAVEPDTAVVFWDGPDTATASWIGYVWADANGCFPEQELARDDRPSVYMTQVDDACNSDSATAYSSRTSNGPRRWATRSREVRSRTRTTSFPLPR